MARGREGKAFELGAPYLSAGGGISYFWPAQGADYGSLFERRRTALRGHLLERARETMGALEMRMDRVYPHLDTGAMSKAVVHVCQGGGWFEAGVFPGNGIAAFHNLEGHKDQVLGFSLASDTLEFLDPDALAPRIVLDGDAYALTYPLPPGTGLLPLQSDSARWRPWLERTVSDLRLGKGASIDESRAEIELDRGKVVIEDGLCKGYGFKGYDAVRATGLLAKLVDSTQFA